MVWSPAVTRAPSVLRIVVCGLVVFMYRAGSRTVPEVDSVQHTNTVSKSSWPKRRGEEAGRRERARRVEKGMKSRLTNIKDRSGRHDLDVTIYRDEQRYVYLCITL